ncbi:MAG TPA: putative glycoside hydrolase [Gemmatimonadaceae bacterium]|nr:putative glycoside hydrolase [Gemmatimonadaceae bacterium]
MRELVVGVAWLALAGGCMASETARGEREQPATQAAAGGAASRAATDTGPKALPLMPRPEVVRGLYVNRWAALGERMGQLIDVAKRTEVNALVIDVKDDRGFLLYRSSVPLARAIGADTNRPMSAKRLRAILDTMRAHEIFPIARIVVAKDPLLAQSKTEWAVKRRSDGTPWLDKNGRPWLDPHHREIWSYAGDIGDEAIALGFGEVQFDYVRFPDEPRLIREATFPLAQGRVRARVIREQLGYLHGRYKAKKVPMAIDVFGLTATDSTDMGIGQKWEQFVDQADVILPMTYPSHYAPGTYGLGNPNARPYAVLDHSLRDAKRRSAGIPGAGQLVPWYQDFTLGPPRYGVEQVRAQIQAGYDNGVRGWMLWNPGSRYTIGALRPAIFNEAEERKRPREPVRAARTEGERTQASSTAPRP